MFSSDELGPHQLLELFIVVAFSDQFKSELVILKREFPVLPDSWIFLLSCITSNHRSERFDAVIVVKYELAKKTCT
jgi:hypothetical protein